MNTNKPVLYNRLFRSKKKLRSLFPQTNSTHLTGGTSYENDIYDLLNDIDNQIDTFETVDITSTDLKNWKQSFALKKKTSVKKHTWKKYAAAAAAFIILLGGSSAPVRQNVYAQSQQIMESLSTLLGTKEDLSPYSTVVGKSISKNGITITLNEVILDGHSLIISYKTKIKDSSVLKNQISKLSLNCQLI